MALLKLPLRFSTGGFFEYSQIDEDYLGARLRVFILSGAGKYLILPSPGIRVMWQQLFTIGPSTKLCSKNVFPESERRFLEDAIKKEANIWLELGKDIIKQVTITGDDKTNNGIIFRTEGYEFVFTFEFAKPGKGLHKDAIGNWNVMERVNVLH